MWVFFVIAATLLQTIRNGFKSELSTSVSAVGVTFARYIWSIPIVALSILLICLFVEEGPYLPNLEMIPYAILTGFFQIIATVAMVQLFQMENYAVGAGLASVAALSAAVAAASLHASEQGTDQERRNDRLSASIKSLGLELEEQEAAWASLQAQIAKNSQVDTDFGDEDASDQLAMLIDRTGNLATAQRELATVQGIMVAGNKGQEEAINIVANAYKGNISALAELTPMTAEQVATLQKIRDPTARGAAALEILNTQYAGLAVTTGTAGAAVKDVNDAKGDLIQKIGQLINASGALQAIIVPITELLRENENELQENSRAAQLFALDIRKVEGGGMVTHA